MMLTKHQEGLLRAIRKLDKLAHQFGIDPQGESSMNTKEMDNLDVTFCRHLLKEAHKLVRQHFPEMRVASGAFWTYHFAMGDTWEFHGPEGFYWHGKAANAYDCRYKGWMAWLKSKGVIES